MADPRELHVARQLVLKSAGFRDKNTTGTSPKVVDFSSEKSVKEECRAYCGPGVDLDQGVPLFTLKDLNATMKGSDVIQPWFLSFADLVRAYVNSTTADEEEAASGLEKLLMEGGVVVGTLDSVLAAVRNGAARRAFMIPPASSLAVMRSQQEGSGAQAAAPADALAAAAADAGVESGGGLFD